MTDGHKIDGLPGVDVIQQAEFLGGVALQMFTYLADEIPEEKRSEIRRGVTLFLKHCIDAKLENVDASAVEHYLQHLVNERISKATFMHLFSVLHGPRKNKSQNRPLPDILSAHFPKRKSSLHHPPELSH